MGKGPRGKVEKSIERYGQPAQQYTGQLQRDIAGRTGRYFDPMAQYMMGGMEEAARRSGQAGNIFYGGGPKTGIDITGGHGGVTGGRIGGGISGNYQQAFEEMFPGEGLTSEDITAKEAELGRMGIRVLRNATGERADKLQFPDGTIVDVIQGAGPGGANRRQWMVETPGGGYRPSGGQGVAGGVLADYSNLMGRYGKFAETGGYSPEDLANIRARAVSPVRAVYSNVMRDIDRQRSLQGGYAPNYPAAKAKAARELAYTTGDVSTNTEAQIAQMVQQGKLAGLGGMAGIYGTTPGLANMFGNQALAAAGQRLQAGGMAGQFGMGLTGQQLQAAQMGNQLGLGLIGSQMQAAQLPGPWETTMGRIGQIGGAIYPWLTGIPRIR